MQKRTVDNIITEELLAHGYEKKEAIGKGGFGNCYLVKSIQYNTDYVCKVAILTDQDKPRIEVLINSYKREKESMSSVYHPNIIDLYVHWEKDDILYLIVEYCQNQSMDKVLQKEQVIDQNRLMQVARDVASAMSYLHSKGICHHDLKPGNFFIDANQNIKLGDFGIAEFYKPGQLCKSCKGTLPYMSPESLRGNSYDPFKSDVWAFGVSIYQMAFGKLPFKGTDIQDFKRAQLLGVPIQKESTHSSTMRLISACLRLDPLKRPSFQEILSMINVKTVRSVLNLHASKLTTYEAKPGVYLKCLSTPSRVVNIVRPVCLKHSNH